MARDRNNQPERGGRGGRGDYDRLNDTPRSLEDEDRPMYETSIRALSIVDDGELPA